MATIKSLKFDLSSDWNGAGVDKARTDLDRLKLAIDELSGKDIKFDADDTAAVAKVDELRAKFAELVDRTIKISADTAEADMQIREVKAQLDELNSKKIRIDLDKANLDAEIAAVKAEMSDIRENIKLGLADDEMKAKLAEDRLELDRLNNQTLHLRAEDTDVKAKIAEIKVAEDNIKTWKQKLDADATQALGEITKLKAEEDALRDKTVNVKVDVDKSKLDQLATTLDDVSKKATAFQGPASNWTALALGMGSAATGVGAQILGLGGAIVSGFGSATLALAPFAASMIDVTGAVKNLNTTLSPLQNQLQVQQQIMQQNAAGAQQYQAAQSSLNATQAAGAGISSKNTAAHQANAAAAASARGQIQQLAAAHSAYQSAASKSQQIQLQINQAMQGATPIEQQLVGNLQNLSDAWHNFQTTAEQFTGPILAQGFVTLTGVIQHMMPLVQAVAPIFQQIIDKAAQFANSNGMTQFVNWIIAVGVPNLRNIVGTITNVFTVLGQIIKAFAPEGLMFTQWLDTTSAKMANWGAGGGFQRFADNVLAQWPQVRAILENVGGAVVHVVQALNGFSTGALAGLMLLSTLLKGLSPGVLQAIAAGFLAIKAAVAFAPIVSALVSAFESLRTALMGVAVAEGAVTAASGGTAAAAGAATAGATAATGAAGKIGTALSGVATALGGGAAAITAGAAIGAAAIGTGIAFWVQSVDTANARAAGVIQHSSGALTAATEANGLHVSTAFQNMANTVSNAGNAAGAKVQDMGGQAQSRFGSYAQNFQAGNQKVTSIMALAAVAVNQQQSDFGQAAGLFVQSMHGNVQKMAQAVQQSGQSLYQTTQSSLTSVFSRISSAMPGHMQQLQQAFTQSASQAFQQMQTTTKTDYNGLKTSMTQYENDLKAGRMTAAQSDSQQLMAAMQTFEQNYASGRISTTNAQTQKVAQAVAAFYQAQAQGDQAKETAAIQQLWQATGQAYQSDANQAGAAQVAADNKMWADVQQSGTAAAAAAGAAIAAAFQSAVAFAQSAAGKAATGGTGSIGSGNTSQGGHGTTYASGGFISGPGSGTSDSIPAMLSNGEFVVTAAATQHHRATLEAINSGRARAYAYGGLVGYATGGAVAASGGSTTSSIEVPDAAKDITTNMVSGFADMGVKGREASNSTFQAFQQATAQGHAQLRDVFRQSMGAYVQQGMQTQQQGISGQLTSDYRQKFGQYAQANQAVHQQQVNGVMRSDYSSKFTQFAAANRQAHQTGITGQMQPDYKTKFTAFTTSNVAAHQAGITGKMQPDYKTKFDGYVTASNQTQTTGITLVQTTFKGHFDTMSQQSSSTVSGDISQIGSAASSAASSALGQARGAVSSAASSMGGTFAFAGGGMVHGAGTGTSDSIPAWLSHGEFVVNAASTAKHAKLLHAINKYGAKFASGGLVDASKVGPGYETASGGSISAVTENGLGGMDIGTMKQIVAEIKANRAKAAAAAAAAAGGGGPGAQGMPSGNLQQWLQQAGIPQSQWGYYATLVQQESGGNPLAYNPSGASGIAQVIPSTFAAYGGGNIWNPVDNLRASWNYAQATYGSLGNIPGLGTGGYKGYAMGTDHTTQGYAWVGEQGPEMVRFSGGQSVDPFSKIVSAMREGASEGQHGGDVNMPVTLNVTAGANPGDVTAEITSVLLPRIEMAIRAGVGRRGR